jgi:hypothetical protein
LGDPTINYIVLGPVYRVRGRIAYHRYKTIQPNTRYHTVLAGRSKSKDPSSFLVLFEDAAAVAGLFIVMICVYISHRFNKPYIDGVASLLVG